MSVLAILNTAEKPAPTNSDDDSVESTSLLSNTGLSSKTVTSLEAAGGARTVNYTPDVSVSICLDDISIRQDDFKKYQALKFAPPTIRCHEQKSTTYQDVVSKLSAIISQDELDDFSPASDLQKQKITEALTMDECRALPIPLRRVLHGKLADSGSEILKEVEAYRTKLATLDRTKTENNTWTEVTVLPATTVIKEREVRDISELAFKTLEMVDSDSARVSAMAFAKLLESCQTLGNEVTRLKAKVMNGQIRFKESLKELSSQRNALVKEGNAHIAQLKALGSVLQHTATEAERSALKKAKLQAAENLNATGGTGGQVDGRKRKASEAGLE